MFTAPYLSFHGSDLDNAFSMIARQLTCQHFIGPQAQRAAQSKMHTAQGESWEQARERANIAASAAGVQLPAVTQRVWKSRDRICPTLDPVGPSEF